MVDKLKKAFLGLFVWRCDMTHILAQATLCKNRKVIICYRARTMSINTLEMYETEAAAETFQWNLYEGLGSLKTSKPPSPG